MKQNVVPASEYHTPYDEALHHLHFAEAKCDTFCGQTEVIGQIKKALVVIMPYFISKLRISLYTE